MLDHNLDFFVIRRDGDFRRGANYGGDVPGAQFLADGGPDAHGEVRSEFEAMMHLDKKHDFLVGIVCAALTDAYEVFKVLGEVGLEDVVL